MSEEDKIGRRDMLARLGLTATAIYAVPSITSFGKVLADEGSDASEASDPSEPSEPSDPSEPSGPSDDDVCEEGETEGCTPPE